LLLGLPSHGRAQLAERPFVGQQPPQAQVTQPAVKVEEEKRVSEAQKQDWVARVFEIKYANDRQIAALRAALSIFPDDIGYGGGRFLTVRAPKEIMPAIEDAIKRLDVPSLSKAAELTAFVLMASNDASTSGPVVPQLQPVINQLKSVLAYKSFQLLDTLIARGTDGRQIDLQGVIMVPGSPASTTYQLRCMLNINMTDEKNPVLQISGLRFTMRVPEAPAGNAVQVQQFRDLQISTDLDVPAGKQVVVGKTTFNDKAFILVLSAKFE
jgi:hypothetical protein